ncbi:winged helix-turn-helix domain-containing protein [Paraflavitalea speifideaquila]|uniref:winged helix-turn-helix domain-containing protein n=1 Tax=Paraflavitalea speifideaquila TaxID=3076558 RepID=UPI0028E2ADFA|nr:HTH domain-containing protein [Paraflavitalea speifideiaquila]
MPTKTITEAIIEVLKRENKMLDIKEIHEKIVQSNLYAFKSSNPEHVVRNQLRRHCDNLELKVGSSIKYFTRMVDGTYGLRKL